MKKETLNCEKARNICIVETLAKLGHFPTRKTEKEAWFLSPFRSESQASFKVSLRLNRWYDHGAGIGGNVIDLICLIKRCSVKEALMELDNKTLSFSFQQQPRFKKIPGIEVIEVNPISHPALLDYLKSRKIKLSTAKLYCKEVHYLSKDKRYFAIGLKNISEGYELRNKFYKSSVSPKDITLIKNKGTKLIVCEGMFDLLSLASYDPTLTKKTDVLVLNSVAFVKRVPDYLKGYNQVILYLDRDNAGEKATGFLLGNHSNAIDNSVLYDGYKDVNQWWMGKSESLM
ncbi:toprim domain-containing protein [Galbibacter orientalis]|uniref:toprim domain-containing protein n=1 Tax=Galbibacter orientalis TaxID=453852 RepID=UPI00307FF737